MLDQQIVDYVTINNDSMARHWYANVHGYTCRRKRCVHGDVQPELRIVVDLLLGVITSKSLTASLDFY